ncbi:MAG TPA: hypothetical protein VGB49_07090, partial [Caulobacteraceae bacterium]
SRRAAGRLHAEAVLAARRLIVHRAVGVAGTALDPLSERGLVQLDDVNAQLEVLVREALAGREGESDRGRSRPTLLASR